jgi:MFS family permease
MKNMVEKYDLECDNSKILKYSVLGSFYLGYAFGSILIPKIADSKGRRIAFVMCLFCQAYIWIIIYMPNEYPTLLILCILFGIVNAGKKIVGFVLLVEMLPKKYHFLVFFADLI